MRARQLLEKQTKEFYGEFESTHYTAIQTAYQAALRYLVEEKMVTIDDYNFRYTAELKQELFRFKSWAMIHEDSAESLRSEIKTTNLALRKILSSFGSILQDMSCISPFLLPTEASPATKKRHRNTDLPTATGASSASPLHKLSDSLANLHANLMSLVGGPLEDEQTTLRSARD